jgi:predicted nucleotidyltransferase
MCTQLKLKEIIEKIVVAAHNSLGDKLDKVILYGSHARGEYDTDSDIDIMVLADIPAQDRLKEREKIRSLTGDLDLEYDVVLSVCVNDCATFYRYANDLPFYMNVLKEGVMLSA